MTYKDIIRNKPYLKICNINGICDRFLRKTHGNAFVVFNNIQQNYEVHTVEAYHLSGDSYNMSIDLDNLNESLIIECLSQDFANNLDDILDARLKHEKWIEDWHTKKREQELNQQFKTIERVIGTKQ